jgi:hypothetical protein
MRYQKIFVPILGLALAGMASATTTFYTTLSGFNTATSGLTFQSISDLASSQTSAGLPLTDPSTGVVFLDQNGASSLLTVVNTGELTVGNFDFSMGIQVPGTYAAYWFDLVTVSPNAQITLNSSISPAPPSPITEPGPAGTETFFGVVTDTPLTLTLGAGNGGIIEIDHVNVGSASQSSATPEGTTMLMIGTGLTLLRLLRSRRVSMAPAAEPLKLG